MSESMARAVAGVAAAIQSSAGHDELVLAGRLGEIATASPVETEAIS
jgi:hypothetical protein